MITLVIRVVYFYILLVLALILQSRLKKYFFFTISISEIREYKPKYGTVSPIKHSLI